MTVIETVKMVARSYGYRFTAWLNNEDMNELLKDEEQPPHEDEYIFGDTGMYVRRMPKPLTEQEINKCLSVLP